MIFMHCTVNDLHRALEIVNAKYAKNVEYKKINVLNNKSTRWQVTLKVKDSYKAGGRLGHARNKDGNRRHINAACWHVHGDLFDAILSIAPDTIIHAGKIKIDKNGGNWQDRDIGSIIEPWYFSEACECT